MKQIKVLEDSTFLTRIVNLICEDAQREGDHGEFNCIEPYVSCDECFLSRKWEGSDEQITTVFKLLRGG